MSFFMKTLNLGERMSMKKKLLLDEEIKEHKKL